MLAIGAAHSARLQSCVGASNCMWAHAHSSCHRILLACCWQLCGGVDKWYFAMFCRCVSRCVRVDCKQAWTGGEAANVSHKSHTHTTTLVNTDTLLARFAHVFSQHQHVCTQLMQLVSVNDTAVQLFTPRPTQVDQHSTLCKATCPAVLACAHNHHKQSVRYLA